MNSKQLEDFARFLEQKNIIQKTIARHEREVNRFEKWLKTRRKTSDNCTKKDLIDYLQFIKEKRQLSNATQSQILQFLKNYYSFLNQSQGINNITSFIKIRGIKKTHLRAIFSTEDVDLLTDAYYAHIQEYTPTAKEIRFNPNFENYQQASFLVLTFIAYQGLQISEVLALQKQDFDLRKATFKVRQSKKGAERTLTLEAVQIGSLISYFQGENETFLSNLNQLERLSKTLKTLHPKFEDFTQLRASKIALWINLFGLRKAQYLAGHKNIQSTEKYVIQDLETLKNDFQNFHPLR